MVNFEMNNKIVSVVVTYNRKMLLVEALKSLLNQTYSPSKVIVIDNASTDSTQEYLEQNGLLDNKVKYIRLEENLGGSAGFYYGIKHALKEESDWICLSDDDAVFNPDYFYRIMQVANENPNIGALTGTVKTNDIITYGHRRCVKNKLTLTLEDAHASNYKKKFFNVDVFTFVGCLINTKLIAEIGLPEKDYFIWYDDIEYSFRIRKLTEIFNVSDAIVDHRTKLPSQIYSPTWKEFYGWRNTYLATIKHSKNAIFASIYSIGCIFGQIASSIIKPKYRGFRRYRIKLFFDVLSAVVRNKKGKNFNYLPGK